MCLFTQQRVFVSRDYPEMMGFLPELIEVVRRLKIDPKVSNIATVTAVCVTRARGAASVEHREREPVLPVRVISLE